MHTNNKAFTLVEILIVVLILGILAAIVLPRFSNASAIARASMLADDLRVTRVQLAIFRAEHYGVAAGYPNCNPNAAPTKADFILHMIKASNASGQTAEPGTEGFNHGPYLRSIPPNPVNGENTVQIIGNGEAFPAAGDDSHGWIYKPAAMLFKADCTGSDENGVSYFDY